MCCCFGFFTCCCSDKDRDDREAQRMADYQRRLADFDWVNPAFFAMFGLDEEMSLSRCASERSLIDGFETDPQANQWRAYRHLE